MATEKKFMSDSEIDSIIEKDNGAVTLEITFCSVLVACSKGELFEWVNGVGHSSTLRHAREVCDKHTAKTGHGAGIIKIQCETVIEELKSLKDKIINL